MRKSKNSRLNHNFYIKQIYLQSIYDRCLLRMQKFIYNLVVLRPFKNAKFVICKDKKTAWHVL